MSGRIVVGVDGSDTARFAARWAAHEARRRGAVLEMVCAWEVPTNTSGTGYVLATDDLVEGLVRNAEETLAAAGETVRLEAGQIPVETRALEGPAVRVLLEASKGADLLVLGSRGLGGFRELLLGSVSQHCAHHATCPVVIVRHADPVAA